MWMVVQVCWSQNTNGHGYRRQMNMMRSMAQKAYEHGLKINEEAQCSKPRAELVYLADANKIYLPRATLLHRCSDLVGCCAHATHSCQPSRVEKVNLYFFTISVQSTNRVRQNQNIEQLSFLNHTDCACMPVDAVRAEQMRQQNSSNLRFFSLPSTVSFEEENVTPPPPAMYGALLRDNNEEEIEGDVQDSNSLLKYWARVLKVLHKPDINNKVEETNTHQTVEVNHGEAERSVRRNSDVDVTVTNTGNVANQPVLYSTPITLQPLPESQLSQQVISELDSNHLKDSNLYHLVYRTL